MCSEGDDRLAWQMTVKTEQATRRDLTKDN